MVLPNKFKITFKTISSLMAGIFLFNQIAWAGDLVNAALEQQYKDQTQTFAPSYLQNQQSAAESLVSQKQAIEDTINTQNLMTSADTQPPADEPIDLKGPRGGSGSETVPVGTAMQTLVQQGASSGDEAVLSVTTQAGDIIHYRAGRIDEIETKDSPGSKIIISRVPGQDLVDADDNLINAQITYVDGTTQVIANGKVSTVTKPDGTVFEYSDTITTPEGTIFTSINGEMIVKAAYPNTNNPDGDIVDYFYTVDNDGNVIETKLKAAEKSSFYDGNGNLLRVEFNTGKLIEYDNGILSKVTTENGKIYIYEKTESMINEEIVYTVKLKEIKDAEGNIFRLENNNITEIEKADGTILRNFQLDASGNLITGEIIYKSETY